MAVLPKTRDGRTALLITVSAVVVSAVIWVGFFGLTGWLVDRADHEVGTTQSE
ncbi:hypothetical protein AAIB33_11695 [Microbacterium sp. AZCO]|uniref:hypothetical protein n=1 Tax=Microbacterium sp. AZCO TaxID=3142976 RepID=UPI0031F3F853